MSPEIKQECHLCRETVETSQLIHCMRCAMVLCKDCDLDHREICAEEVRPSVNFYERLQQKLSINQVIGTFNRASRSVS